MKYVLVNNNSVVMGPIEWNYRMFEHALANELEIPFTPLPSNESDVVIPMTIDAETKIMEAVFAPEPSYNSKIEFLQGPFWNFDNDIATASFTVEPMQLDAVKNSLKAQIAATRYAKEVSGVKVTLQGKEYTVDTNRGARDIFLQAAQLNAAGYQWKFPEGWITLSVAELQTVVGAIMTHVQDQFSWEAIKVIEIESAATLPQLDAITLE